MRKVARTLEASLAAHSASFDDAGRQQRRNALTERPNAIDRRLALGLDTFVAKHRRAATTVLNGLSHSFGSATYLGNGAWSSVYRRGDEVVKIYRNTATMTPEEREADMARRQAMCANLCGNLGAIGVEQTFSIGEHILGGYQVVMGHQPFVGGGKLDLFTTNTLDLCKTEVAAYCERQADGQAQLLGLVEVTFLCDDDGGLLPDLNGADNFRLAGDTERLRLIDSEPVAASEHPGVHAHILRQAETLSDFLGAA